MDARSVGTSVVFTVILSYPLTTVFCADSRGSGVLHLDRIGELMLAP